MMQTTGPVDSYITTLAGEREGKRKEEGEREGGTKERGREGGMVGWGHILCIMGTEVSKKGTMVASGHMTHSTVEFHSSLQRGSGVDGTEVIQPWEHGTGGTREHKHLQQWATHSSDYTIPSLPPLHTSHLLR